MVYIKIPATTANFGPGFDCIGAALNLYNYVGINFSEKPEILVKKGYDKEIPKDKTNLIYVAAHTVLRQLGINRSLKITVYNNIPIARGLGSSAACIIGGIVAANYLAGDVLSVKEILYHATKIEGHADNVVPALLGGFCISLIYNSEIYYKKILLPEYLRFVVGIPEFSLKTREARDVIPKNVDLQDAVFNLSRCACLVTAIIEHNFEDLNVFCQDKLHQPYRKLLIPGINEILDKSKDYGALASFLSGAGPSVICLSTKNNANYLGEFIKNSFYQVGIRSTYKILTPSNSGVEVIEK